MIAVIAFLLAALPALMVLRNLALFLPPAQPSGDQPKPRISVLIPARDEAATISQCMNAALRSEGVEVEVVVLDDHSSDATADVVQAVRGRDTRVRLVQGKPLPEGWNGKQHACWQLAATAQYPLLVFLDADVRLASDGLARLVAEMRRTGVDLLSPFPHQETQTWLERLLIPMMHYILLGFLPIERMRRSTHPAYAAGCGQLFLTSQRAYDRAGSHAAIRRTRHDGLMLPKAYRRAGLSTDVCDGTHVASCRMYHSASEVIRGLLKNATEGIAHPARIVPFTLLLIGGSVLPFVWLPVAVVSGSATAILLTGAACLLAYLPRWRCAVRFSQSKLGAALHPIAVLLFVALQWQALVQQCFGKRVAWKGRIDAT
ncbi:glycosyltransferase [Candidatus Laterigemmans baculatus]|uniref:glycosyltransferase n=1 Tax=Candidatus Laterigemmans baculatus TaxID=2770505 RepID=UPI001F1BBBDA|nr:glycosyltransferase [Candidatus Laterigemmans baculatus]